jgi:prevent-host-death family protein
MRTYSTNEARNRFAEIINMTKREPVAIAKHGRVVSVILAKEDYEHFQVIEEERWMSYKTIKSDDASERINARIEKLEKQLSNACA